MSAQIIQKAGKPEYAVLPYDEYLELLNEAEMARDVAAYDEVKARLAQGEEELLPGEMVERLIGGENPVRVWREYRGLSGQRLAEAAGISAAYLSQLEAQAREGSVKVLRAIARALKVKIDDLVIEP